MSKNINISWMTQNIADRIAHYLVGADYTIARRLRELTINDLFTWTDTPEGGIYWADMSGYGPASNLPSECKGRLMTYLLEWDRQNPIK